MVVDELVWVLLHPKGSVSVRAADSNGRRVRRVTGDSPYRYVKEPTFSLHRQGGTRVDSHSHGELIFFLDDEPRCCIGWKRCQCR